MSTYQEIMSSWASALFFYEKQEAETLVSWLFEHHLGLNKGGLLEHIEEQSFPARLYEDFERLKSGEPIQYILGKGPFYGREFLVGPATLIPRNETEELVHLIIKENRQPGLKLLDIGTGTGCIPVTLGLEMNNPEVFAVDISEEALKIAHQNSDALGAKVMFMKCDILSENPSVPQLDILVSNPPYIPEIQKQEMHRNVLEFEPALALFVPDDDPLLFYRTIAKKGKQLLKPDGKLYFEINEEFGKEVASLLSQLGYFQIQIIKDLNGKNRIVKGLLSF